MTRKFSVVIITCILLSSSLWGGGWNNTLMGSRALAIGAAFIAVADDPSAVYYNPAGLVYMGGRMNVSFNGFYIRPTHEYVLPTGSAIQSRNDSSFPQFFFSYRTSEKLTLGFGAYIPYAGGGVEWRDDEIGFLKSSLGVVSLTPTLAYQLSPTLAIGFQLNFYRGILDVDTESAVYGTLASEESGTSLSGGLSVLFKPHDRLSLGLGVRGPAKMTLSGKTAIPIEMENLGTINVKLESETRFKLPWDFEFGIAYRLKENILISGSAQYTMWSSLDKVEKVVKNIPGIGEMRENEILDFQNILILRAGAEFEIPGGIFLRGGLGMDRAASPTETLTIANVDVDKFTLLGGVGYRSGRTEVNFVFVKAMGREREKRTSVFGLPLTESYNLSASIFGLGVTFSF